MGMRRTIYIKKRKTQLRCQKVPSPLMQGMPSVSLPLDVMLLLSGMLCLLGLGTLTQSVAAFNPLMSLPLCHLENDQHEREIWNPSAFLFFLFWHWLVKGSSSKRVAWKAEVLWDRNINCLQARPCIFQPGSFTGWGSEGVKTTPKNRLFKTY